MKQCAIPMIVFHRRTAQADQSPRNTITTLHIISIHQYSIIHQDGLTLYLVFANQKFRSRRTTNNKPTKSCNTLPCNSVHLHCYSFLTKWRKLESGYPCHAPSPGHTTVASLLIAKHTYFMAVYNNFQCIITETGKGSIHTLTDSAVVVIGRQRRRRWRQHRRRSGSRWRGNEVEMKSRHVGDMVVHLSLGRKQSRMHPKRGWQARNCCRMWVGQWRWWR
jgi:hypothetical protein